MTNKLRMTRRLIPIAILSALAVAPQPPVLAQEIQYREDPDAEKRMTLLLKDWDPKPMVHLPGHKVPRAKFYVIDVHNHVDDASVAHGEEIPPADVVKGMDQANVKKVVILTGMWGEKLQGVLDRMVKPPILIGSWSSRKWTGAKLTIPISAPKWSHNWTMQ